MKLYSHTYERLIFSNFSNDDKIDKYTSIWCYLILWYTVYRSVDNSLDRVVMFTRIGVLICQDCVYQVEKCPKRERETYGVSL